MYSKIFMKVYFVILLLGLPMVLVPPAHSADKWHGSGPSCEASQWIGSVWRGTARQIETARFQVGPQTLVSLSLMHPAPVASRLHLRLLDEQCMELLPGSDPGVAFVRRSATEWVLLIDEPQTLFIRVATDDQTSIPTDFKVVTESRPATLGEIVHLLSPRLHMNWAALKSRKGFGTRGAPAGLLRGLERVGRSKTVEEMEIEPDGDVEEMEIEPDGDVEEMEIEPDGQAPNLQLSIDTLRHGLPTWVRTGKVEARGAAALGYLLDHLAAGAAKAVEEMEIEPDGDVEEMEIEPDFVPCSSDDHGDGLACPTLIHSGETVVGELWNSWQDDDDVFSFYVTSPRTSLIASRGNTDTFGTLYNNQGEQVAWNDNAGDGRNFRIVRFLEPGRYFVRVSGSFAASGTYSLNIAGWSPAASGTGK